jgi:hypothetical protein
MFRPLDNVIFDYDLSWEIIDPDLPRGVLGVCLDTGTMKVGDGERKWSEIQYGGGTLGYNPVVNKHPTNDNIIFFNEDIRMWDYRIQGKFDTLVNWQSDTTVYPKFSLLGELNSVSLKPTGRFKFSNGTTSFDLLPWAGSEIDATEFPTGYSLEFNGTYFEPAHYVQVGESPSSLTPTGYKFARDDGIWADPAGDALQSIPISVDGNLIAFDGVTGNKVKDTGVHFASVATAFGTPNDYFQIHFVSGPRLYDISGELHIKTYNGLQYGNVRVGSIYSEFATTKNLFVGGFPTESTSVSVTSDGTFLYVDGGKIVSSFTDGHGSGSDADTLDTYHSSYFAPATELASVRRKALIYSTIMGGL